MTGQRAHRVLLVIGTRPEAVKFAPLVRAMTADHRFDPVVVTTGQHREMLDQVLSALDVVPDVRLDVMRERQDLHRLTSRLSAELGTVVTGGAFDALVVQGDTTTALCGALAGFYAGIPVAHVEAGLRSGVPTDPFPEEQNRRLVSRLARWHLAPTLPAGTNLLREGICADDIEITGNTVVDNLLWVVGRGLGRSAFGDGGPARARSGPRIVLTLHRRENQGPVMARLARAVAQVAEECDAEVVLPLHRSPAVRDAVLPVLGEHPHVRLTEPLDYLDFTATLAAADLALTDSGGVQEEAPSLDVPVLVLRNTTERMEAVRAGAALLVGTDPQEVRRRTLDLLADPERVQRMRSVPNPFGDGRAAERILERLARDLGPRAVAREVPGAATLAGSPP
ncbi:non-hydrolyzing UDP-N-acetylglucosamine 2-epimerase [Kineococcus sp. LSe6-4]|uniref:UDP-N-acetylglucosamine 2-epimerase (non-hydrolyzing) n=1 Tax=Kineococcus halophytocola TaxID=3234027 RepID=A0ABV4GZL2_9ACTN